MEGANAQRRGCSTNIVAGGSDDSVPLSYTQARHVDQVWGVLVTLGANHHHIGLDEVKDHSGQRRVFVEIDQVRHRGQFRLRCGKRVCLIALLLQGLLPRLFLRRRAVNVMQRERVVAGERASQPRPRQSKRMPLCTHKIGADLQSLLVGFQLCSHLFQLRP